MAQTENKRSTNSETLIPKSSGREYQQIPIVWAGRKPDPRLQNDFSIEYFFKLDDCRKYLEDHRACVLVVDFAKALEGFDFLRQLREIAHSIVKIFSSDSLEIIFLDQGLKQYSIFSFVQPQTVLPPILVRAQMQSEQLERRSALLRQATRQIREFETINESLETLVNERTDSLAHSEKEETESLQQARSFIRYLNEIGNAAILEDLITIFRKELKKFHRIGEPIFLYQENPLQWRLLTTKSGLVQISQTSWEQPAGGFSGQVSAEYGRFLANHFSRPFIKTLVFGLDLQSTSARFCIESSMEEHEEQQFIEFVHPRLQALAMSLDRILIETQMSQYSYRWERTFDLLQTPIAILDIDFEVLRGNKNFAGRSIRGKCHKLFASLETPCEGCPLPLAVKTGQVQTGTIRISEKIFEVTSYPIKLGIDGRITNVVNQYRDVTQSRELYLRMLQSEKMSALGILAGNIAHELNNPLTGLRSLAQVLIQDKTVPAQVQQDLQEVEKAAVRSQTIIRNLLEFSQEGEVPREKVSMDELVHKTLILLKVALRNHNLNLQLQSDSAQVLVEPHMMQQVIFNLINNACQAMKERGEVKVSTEIEGKAVVLKVSDQGCGVAETHRQKIFEPFFTTKKEGLGTGLGLSLSKKIVEAHGGEISLSEKRVGVGAEFVVRIPRVT
jgi:two-component system NtrC family sensor kinase